MYPSLTPLLRAISNGDEHAFRQVMHRFGDRLYQFALGIVKTPQDAEEIVSDVFLKIWHLRKQLPESEQFPFYLYRAVKHTSLNYLKKKTRKKEVEAAYTLQAVPYLSRTPEEMVISKENLLQINQAINDLPLRCRQVFILVKEDRLSYRQVAELLDISTATVNAQMTIAVKKIWHSLDAALQESPS